MTECNLAALGGAEAVVVEHDSMGREVMAVWYGGTTFRVFRNAHEYPLDERTVFSLSDEKGEPVDREEAVQHAREWLQETLEE